MQMFLNRLGLLNLAVLGIVIVSIAASEVMASENLGIHVSGRGEVLAEPDMAYMTLEASRQGRDAVALKAELDQITSETLRLTDTLDIPRKDVTAALVNIRPNHRREGSRNVIDGVVASRTITIVLRDLARYGELMNGALKLGVNNIGGVRLDTSERVELEQQALALAIEDAKAEAARVAKDFDVRLGGVTNVHVSDHQVRPQMARMSMDSAESGGAFSPGQMTVSRNIQATFSIGGQ